MVDEITIARPIAAEDIKIGSFLMVLATIDEFVRSGEHPAEPLRIERLVMAPCCGQMPRKVLAVSVPFVLVETHKGETETIDLRNVRVAVVHKAFGGTAWTKSKPPTPPEDSPPPSLTRARWRRRR